MSTNGNDDPPDEKSATVIPWPGRPAPQPPEAPTPEKLELADPEAVDAFEQAVRRAVHDKLAPGQDTPKFPPRAPDDLIAQVYSALSGKDPAEALDEVRQQIAARVAAVEEGGGQGADIIDLAAAREARQRAANETQTKVGGALRDTFNQFMAQMSALNGGRTELTLDAGFFKEHGPALLGNLFQGLASALLKKDAPVPPAPVVDAGAGAETGAETDARAEAGAETEAAAPAAPTPPSQVNVKVDFASILSSLFRRRDPSPAPSPAPSPSPSPSSSPPPSDDQS